MKCYGILSEGKKERKEGKWMDNGRREGNEGMRHNDATIVVEGSLEAYW